jgi:hypothetical protein
MHIRQTLRPLRRACALLCACLLMLCAAAARAETRTELNRPTAAQQARLEAIRAQVTAQLDTLAAEGIGYGMIDALRAWMLPQMRVVSGARGAVYIEIPQPRFGDSYPSLPDYDGQDPAQYLRQWHAAMRDIISRQRAVGQPLSLAIDSDLSAPVFRAWIGSDVLPKMDAWLWTGFSRAKAVGAMSRMMFSLPTGYERWQLSQYVRSGQAERYASGRNTDNASALLAYLASANGLTQTQVRRWWTVYRGSLGAIEWSAPTGGIGPVLTYNAPSVSPMLSQTISDALVDAYTHTRLSRENTVSAVVEYARNALSTLPANQFTRVRFSVNLAAFAQNGSLDAYESFGVRHVADGLAEFTNAMDQIDVSFQQYVATHIAPQAFPQSGALLKPPAGNAELVFANQSTANAYYVRIYRADSGNVYNKADHVGTVFVRPAQKVSVRIKPGYYCLSVAYGARWYGEEWIFGDNANYQRVDRFYCERGYRHPITLAGKPASNGAVMTTKGIGLSEM